MERVLRTDRAYAVAGAAARDLNNELTVILSTVSDLLESSDESDPAHIRLLDLQSAAQRCVWKAAGLLQFSARRGLRPSSAPLESLIGE
ncbi:MAG: hypothetical protein ABSG03_23785 [Bryobacteraceae bacterium]